MILQKRRTRTVGTTLYHQFVVGLPAADVKALGWQAGDEIVAERREGGVFLRPANAVRVVGSVAPVVKDRPTPMPAKTPVVMQPTSRPAKAIRTKDGHYWDIHGNDLGPVVA